MREARHEGFAARTKPSFSGRANGPGSAQQPLGKGSLGDVELGLLPGLIPFHQVTRALLPRGLRLERHCRALSHGVPGRARRLQEPPCSVVVLRGSSSREAQLAWSSLVYLMSVPAMHRSGRAPTLKGWSLRGFLNPFQG